MTCRCKSPGEHESRLIQYESASNSAETSRLKSENADLRSKLSALTPDSSKFEIEDVNRVDSYLILTVKYQECQHAGYKGRKILVFSGPITESELIKWRSIDPHFREPSKAGRTPTSAPQPIARFPASDEGLKHAKLFAQSLLPRPR